VWCVEGRLELVLHCCCSCSAYRVLAWIAVVTAGPWMMSAGRLKQQRAEVCLCPEQKPCWGTLVGQDLVKCVCCGGCYKQLSGPIAENLLRRGCHREDSVYSECCGPPVEIHCPGNCEVG